MSLITPSQYKVAQSDLDAATNVMNGFNFAYLAPPNTAAGVKRQVTITPVANFSNSDSNGNPALKLLTQLPGIHTIPSCIQNAAIYASQYKTSNSLVDTEPGSFTSVSDVVSSVTNQSTNQYFPGLNFRIFGQYHNDNVNIFKGSNTQFEFDTTTINWLQLPSDFTHLGVATGVLYKPNGNESKVPTAQDNADLVACQAVMTAANNQINIYQGKIQPLQKDVDGYTYLLDAVYLTRLQGIRDRIIQLNSQLSQATDQNTQAKIQAQLATVQDQLTENTKAANDMSAQRGALNSQIDGYNLQIAGQQKILNNPMVGVTNTTYNGNINYIGRWPNSVFVQRPSSTKHNFAIEWFGFFRPNVAGTWSFQTRSDDASYLWVGPHASSDYTTSNATVNNGNAHASNNAYGNASFDTAGIYYPLRIHFGEQVGDYDLLVSVKPPGGSSYISDLTGFVFTQVRGPVTSSTTSTDIGNWENPVFKTSDPNPVYIAMEYAGEWGQFDRDPVMNADELAAGIFPVHCLIGTGKMDDLLANAHNYSPNTSLQLWKSPGYGVLSTLADTFAAVDVNGNLFLQDGTGATTYISASSRPDLSPLNAGNTPGQSYMYLATYPSSTGLSLPLLTLVNTVTGQISAIDFNKDDAMFSMVVAKLPPGTQTVNHLWIYNQATTYLAYNASVSPNGITYTTQLNGTNNIFSADGIWRLVVLNGHLILEMSVSGKHEFHGDYGKVFINNPDVAPGGISIMKIDVDHQFNQMHMVDTVHDKSYFVPKDYTILSPNGKYTQYSENYPPSTLTAVLKSGDECQTACSSDPNCAAYYTFNKGGQQWCSQTQSNVGQTDYIFSHPIFNPPQDNTMQKGQMFLKNKEVETTPTSEISTLVQTSISDAVFPKFTGSLYTPISGAVDGPDPLSNTIYRMYNDLGIINNYHNQPLSTQEGFVVNGQTYQMGAKVYEDAITEIKSNVQTVMDNQQTISGQALNIANLESRVKSMDAALKDQDRANIYSGDYLGVDVNPDNHTSHLAYSDAYELAVDTNTIMIISSFILASAVILAIVFAR